jgi:DNA repair protein RecN (Recombination protein N)
LRRTVQRELLDEFGRCDKQTSAVAEAYREWREVGRQLESLSDGADDVPSRIDLLRFQADEIERLDITRESLSILEAEHRRVAHAARLLEGCDAAAAHAFGHEGSALSSTVKAATVLNELSAIDNTIPALVELLDQAMINLEEAERELTRIRASIDTDPRRLQEIDSQLQSIQDIARKHRCDASDIPDRLVQIRMELEELSNREEKIQQLNKALAVASEAYGTAAGELHRSRVRAAKKMDGDISRRLRELGIAHGEFNVRVEHNARVPSVHGDDDIEFLVTANPDLPLKPLKKVASGGELSRISLAIQVATTGSSGIPVLVFDEVDTGVGGATAEIVAQYLNALAEQRQILCITHLPQVASAGDHHLSIGKIVAGGITETTVRCLDAEERIEEIARMLGGKRITEKAREHARELLTP